MIGDENGNNTGFQGVPGSSTQRDSFSNRKGAALLVSQIEASVVGLNIQAASVVILTEPPWKPATKNQAITRCHRMGHVRPVEVHRLLTTNSVGEHMNNTLAHKSAMHDKYARASTTRKESPEATDKISAGRIFNPENQPDCERQIIELERRRLGLEYAVPTCKDNLIAGISGRTTAAARVHAANVPERL